MCVVTDLLLFSPHLYVKLQESEEDDELSELYVSLYKSECYSCGRSESSVSDMYLITKDG